MSDLVNSYSKNIPKYLIYTALKGFAFGPFGALWAIFLTQHRGMTLAEAALVDVTFFIAAAVGEVPTGMVADTWGRKTSMACGTALMTISALGWTFAPTMPLIMLSYIAMGIGFTFLSGAEDALFYESVQQAGRTDDYTRLAGRAGAIMLGAVGAGSVLGGVLASISLTLPFIVSSVALAIMLILVLSLKEPQTQQQIDGTPRQTFRQILGQSLRLMRARPALRYPMIYMAVVPLASFVVEVILLQPQALALGVPIAGIGVIVASLNLINMAGSNWSDHVKKRIGEVRVIYIAPVIILGFSVLLAAWQVLPALLFVAVISLTTAVLRPILLARIQTEVSDDVRATILSMMQLMFTFTGAISQPTLAYVADEAGLPAAYLVMVGVLSVVITLLLWISRHHFPHRAANPIEEAPAEAIPVP